MYQMKQKLYLESSFKTPSRRHASVALTIYGQRPELRKPLSPKGI